MTLVEILLNGLRLRILHAVGDGQPFTTSQLAARLPDVSTPTVYRQVAVLADAGLLEVTHEQRVRGAVERTYRLRSAAMDAVTIAALSEQDHQQLFAASVGALLAEFTAYVARDGADPLADSVSYRHFTVWLSEEEKARLIRQVYSAIQAVLGNEPTADRRRHLLSTILFPTDARDRPVE